MSPDTKRSRKHPERKDVLRLVRKSGRDKVRKAREEAARRQHEKQAPGFAIAESLVAGILRARKLANGHSISKIADDPEKLAEYILKTSLRIHDELGL